MILLKVAKMEIFGLTDFVCNRSYAGIQHFNKGSYLTKNSFPDTPTQLLMSKLVINKGYGVQATTTRGPNVVKRFCSNAVLLREFQLTDGQNTSDQISRSRRFKHA